MDELLLAMEGLRDAVKNIRAAAEGLNDLGEPPDYGDLTLVFCELNDLGADLREARADVGYHAHQSMPRREVHVEGVGPVEKTWGFNRSQWQNEALLRRALAWARDERRVLDEETGEYESDGDALARILPELVGIAYWKLGDVKKKTGLRGRGLKDPDEFCHKEPKRESISVPSSAVRAANAVKASLRGLAFPERPSDGPQAPANAGEVPEGPEASHVA